MIATGRGNLAPYGRHVLAARRSGELCGFVGTSRDGLTPTIWLLVGINAWTVARRWSRDRLIVVAPCDEDAATFDWSCIGGADPVLLVRCGDVDGRYLERALAAVFRDGVDRILDLDTGVRYVAQREIRHVA